MENIDWNITALHLRLAREGFFKKGDVRRLREPYATFVINYGQLQVLLCQRFNQLQAPVHTRRLPSEEAIATLREAAIAAMPPVIAALEADQAALEALTVPLAAE